MSRKFLVVGFVLFVAVFIAGYFFINLVERDRITNERTIAAQQIFLSENEKARGIYERMQTTLTLPKWEIILTDITVLSENRRLALGPIAQGKRFEARSLERDQLLFYAGKLLKVNKNDPLAGEYLEEAKKLHMLNMGSISEFSLRDKNCEWNARLWYRKGIEYYRSLIFIKKEEESKALDLIDQSIRNFEKVFTCYSKDQKTEVAIELLYKRAKEIKSAGSLAGPEMRLRLLPSQEIEPGARGDVRREGRH